MKKLFLISALITSTLNCQHHVTFCKSLCDYTASIIYCCINKIFYCCSKSNKEERYILGVTAADDNSTLDDYFPTVHD